MARPNPTGPRIALLTLVVWATATCTPFPTAPLTEVDGGDTGADSADTADNGDTDGAGRDADDPDAAECVPVCDGARCGPDGCGNACGTCGAGEGCADDGACTPAPWAMLVEDAVGFSGAVTGGTDGGLCTVTSLEDSGVGSLRGCLSRPPVWVRFAVAGRIGLIAPLRIPSHTTVDGRGQRVILAGQPLLLASADNVILHNLTLDGTTYPETAGIHIGGTSRGVWLHHLSVSRFKGAGLVVEDQASEVTLAWSFFTDLDAVALLGQSADGSDVRVTVHHNLFRAAGGFAPGVRGARVHLFNNVIESWDQVAAASFDEGQLHSERNLFQNADGGLALTTMHRDEPQEGYTRSVEDAAGPSVVIEQNRPELVFQPSDSYPYSVEEPDDALRTAVNRGAGYRDEAFPE